MLSAAKNRKSSACCWVPFTLSPSFVDVTLVCHVELQDGIADVTPAFWEVIGAPSKWLPKPPAAVFLPSPPVDLAYFISSARTVSQLQPPW